MAEHAYEGENDVLESTCDEGTLTIADLTEEFDEESDYEPEEQEEEEEISEDDKDLRELEQQQQLI